MKKRVIFIKNDKLNNSKLSYEQILNSTLKYNHFNVTESPQCVSNIEFWKRQSASLEYLKVEEADCSFEFLNELKRLKSLYLKNFIDDKITYEINVENSFQNTFVQSNMLSVQLKKSEDAYCLPNLFKIIPEPIHFVLKIKEQECSPLDGNARKLLFDYFQGGRNRIKTIRLRVDEETLKCIFTVNGMNIESFANDGKLSVSNELNPLEIGSFTDRNKMLHLKLPYMRFSTFCRHFPNLETIAFKVDPLKNRTQLKNLKKLKVKLNYLNFFIIFVLIFILFFQSLFMSHYFQLRDNLLPNKTGFEHLFLVESRVDRFEKLSNLTVLSMCLCTVDNRILQNIIQNLTKLREFYIYDYSDDLTEYGITGVMDSKQIGVSISNLKDLEVLFLQMLDLQMGDETLDHITKLKKLRALDMYFSPSWKDPKYS